MQHAPLAGINFIILQRQGYVLKDVECKQEE